jgi:hypothetical protein
MAIVNYFGAVPIPLPLPPLWEAGGTKLFVELSDKMQVPMVAFFDAAKLTMSDSEHMLHSVEVSHGRMTGT